MYKIGLEHKLAYDDYKRKGSTVYTKYQIISCTIDIKVLNRINEIMEEYNNIYLEHDFNGGVHASVKKLDIILEIKKKRAYIILLFIDTFSKDE